MNRPRSAAAVLAGMVVPLPLLLLWHCGGGNPTQSGGDATAQDAPAGDAKSEDVSAVDPAAPDADAAVEGAAPDVVADVAEAEADAFDAADGGGDQDAADGGEEADATPCVVDAGEGGPSCEGPLTCCSGWCTNTKTDPRNCGSCGNACMSAQFCTGVACDDAVMKNVCANPAATVIFDRAGPDNATGNALGMALSTGCMPAVMVLAVDQDAGTAQDLATGRPLTGPGDTLVAGGGSYLQTTVGYMDRTALTTIYPGADGTSAWFRNRNTSMNVVFAADTALTAGHDYFLLELSVEPVSGTLCFFGYGLGAPGTTAAGYFFQSNVMPSLPTFADAWYVYEWTDTDANGMPSAGDTFTLLAHGT